MNAEELAEEQRQIVEKYKRETGGKSETYSCSVEYKLTVKFESKCINYGHRKNTAAFNQCVGMERNNQERQQQLERMEAKAEMQARKQKSDNRRLRRSTFEFKPCVSKNGF